MKDNWFTSVSLAQLLLDNFKLTVVGPLLKSKPVKTSLFGFTKDLTLVSYKPRINKTVMLLFTLNDDDEIDKNTGTANKPETITFYQSRCRLS